MTTRWGRRGHGRGTWGSASAHSTQSERSSASTDARSMRSRKRTSASCADRSRIRRERCRLRQTALTSRRLRPCWEESPAETTAGTLRHRPGRLPWCPRMDQRIRFHGSAGQVGRTRDGEPAMRLSSFDPGRTASAPMWWLPVEAPWISSLQGHRRTSEWRDSLPANFCTSARTTPNSTDSEASSHTLNRSSDRPIGDSGGTSERKALIYVNSRFTLKP